MTDNINQRELYQEVVLDHNRYPRNYGSLTAADKTGTGVNTLCGDHLQIELKIDNDIISDIKFSGSSCAIARASASVMTEMVKGKSVKEARQLISDFVENMLQANTNTELPDKLQIFQNVSQYPMRVKCATIAWHALDSALSK